MTTIGPADLANIGAKKAWYSKYPPFKEPVMKYIPHLILAICLFLLCACTFFYAKQQSAPDAAVQSPKPLAIPVGKNWQVIEEAPKLSDERGRLPFQTEDSLQPEGAKPVLPADNRTIETSH
jgi:hypothetical protein